jgi:hypothetical protein
LYAPIDEIRHAYRDGRELLPQNSPLDFISSCPRQPVIGNYKLMGFAWESSRVSV